MKWSYAQKFSFLILQLLFLGFSRVLSKESSTARCLASSTLAEKDDRANRTLSLAVYNLALKAPTLDGRALLSQLRDLLDGARSSGPRSSITLDAIFLIAGAPAATMSTVQEDSMQ
jgi:hypothetical protein